MIAIDIDISGTVKSLNSIQRKQLPYAAAKALTKTAQDGQYDVRKQMFNVFTIRNTWTQSGVVITPATKTNLYAEVVARPDYLHLQEDGGEKVPHAGHIYVAVPIRENLGLANNQLIPTNLRPSRLKDSFIVTLKDGRKFIFMRTGQGHNAIVPVYRLIHEALVKGVLKMETTVLATVNKMFAMRFDEAMAEAVATSF